MIVIVIVTAVTVMTEGMIEAMTASIIVGMIEAMTAPIIVAMIAVIAQVRTGRGVDKGGELF
ncbi:MAG: hypothetical protein V4749_14795 [Pseudomonadota bacterium]